MWRLRSSPFIQYLNFISTRTELKLWSSYQEAKAFCLTKGHSAWPQKHFCTSAVWHKASSMLFEFFWKCFNEQILAYICNMTEILPHVDLYIITCVIAFVTFETAATEIYIHLLLIQHKFGKLHYNRVTPCFRTCATIQKYIYIFLLKEFSSIIW